MALSSKAPERRLSRLVAFGRLVSVAGTRPYTVLVFIAGLALRAVLVPIAHGDDFTVWDLAARYTLAGVNIYRDHPPYPGGPYAYFPLFLYVELPFQWLALRTGVPFTILGKLPIVAGDILTGILIARILVRRGYRDPIVALGVALYVLNPLVLYNGAFYGRFDTLCAGLLLLAVIMHEHHPPGAPASSQQRPSAPPGALAVDPPLLGTPAARRQEVAGESVDEGGRRGDDLSRRAAGAPSSGGRGQLEAGAPGGYGWAFPLLYALAIAMKSYPVFLLPWLLVRDPHGRKRLLIALASVLGGLSLPYVLTSPRRFVADILLYDAHKTPGHLSWQVLLLGILSPHAARLVSYLLLALFVVGLYLYRRLDLWTYCLVSILLFILLSKVVIEQYFLWPLPFLILDALERHSWASWGLLLLLSAAGMLVNAHVHPFGENPWPIALALAAGIVAYLVAVTRRARRGEVTV